MREGAWDEARIRLERALEAPHDGDRPDLVARALRLHAECLWRLDRGDEAVARARQAIDLAPSTPDARAARVLVADVDFAAGRREEACIEYRRAAAEGRTRWVDLQLERCADHGAATGGSS
jgi:tetratricopeptide (TPR) repeat protein